MRSPLPLVFLAAAADVVSLSGQWRVHSNVFGSESDRSCSFVQEHLELKGTCTSGRASESVTGRVEGKRVTWEVKTEEDGKPLTIEFTGTVISDEKIAGTMTLVQIGVDGEFTATKAK